MNDRIKWAVLRQKDNKLDGYREWLVGDWKDPSQIGPKLFHTRREARLWAKARFGYISRRSDLRAEPHGWKPAKVVKVLCTYEVLK